MRSFSFLFLLLCFGTVSYTQGGYLGIQVGNNLSLPNYFGADHIKEGSALRYSIGLVGRLQLADKIKFDVMLPVRDGVLSLDYGVNLLVHGYSYSLGGVDRFQEQFSVQAPLMLSFYDRKNVMISRRIRKKGINTFTRFGFVPSFSSGDQRDDILTYDDRILQEIITERKFNLFVHVGFGVQRHSPNGKLTMFEIALNHGLIPRITADVALRDLNTGRLTVDSFQKNEALISTRMIYFFAMGNGT